jgi:ribA/ribD-fused uncharacterized protein
MKKSKKGNIIKIPKDQNDDELEININDIKIKEFIEESKNKELSKKTNNVVTFWRPMDQNGWLGQWYESEFELTDNIINDFPDEINKLKLITEKPFVLEKLIEHRKFNTAEKFMMMGKAALFADDVVYNKMALIDSPREHKRLGQQVSNFREDVWRTYCRDIVKIGNYLKFDQNNDLKHKLLKTNDAIIIEGSPVDKIWGVGLKFNDPLIRDKTKWRGLNYLGECLMFVREFI